MLSTSVNSSAAEKAAYERGGRAAVKNLAHRICRLLCRIEHHGKENLPRQGPCILASNHQTFLDPIFIGASLPWRMRFMARDDLFTIPLFGRLIAWLGAFPVDRKNPHKSAYMRCKEVLVKDKDYLVVFPEGQRARDGRLGEFKPGAVRMALAFQATLVPISILGGYHVWPPHRRFPRPGKIQVLYHPPVFSPGVTELPSGGEKEQIAFLVEQLQKKIATPSEKINFLKRP